MSMGRKKILLVCSVLFLLLLATGSIWYIWSISYGYMIRGIAESGDPVSIRDLAPEKVPDSENAAFWIAQTTKDVGRLSAELMSAYKLEEDPNWPTAKQVKVILLAWEKYPELYPLLEKAGGCTSYVPKLNYNVPANVFMANALNEVAGTKTIARMLSQRAIALAEQGETTQSIDTCLLMFRLSRVIDKQPLLIDFLVGSAFRNTAVDATNRVLRTFTPTAEQHALLETELALHDNAQRFIWALKSERAFAISNLDTFNPLVRMMGAKDVLLLFQHEIDLANSGDISPLTYTPTNSSLLASLVSPALLAARTAHLRTESQLRCLRVLNALLAQKPEVANDLDPATLGLPEKSIVDPISGKKLQVRHVEQGWVVSTGGQLDSIQPLGPIGWQDKIIEAREPN